MASFSDRHERIKYSSVSLFSSEKEDAAYPSVNKKKIVIDILSIVLPFNNISNSFLILSGITGAVNKFDNFN